MIFWPPPVPGQGIADGNSPVTPMFFPAAGTFGLGQGALPYEIPVRWYYCQPQAQILPFPTAFTSAGWDMEGEWNSPIGEVNTLGRFLVRVRNRTPTSATGQRTCNSPDQWANGLAGPPSVAVRYDDQGIPFCCGTQIGAPAAGNIGFREFPVTASSNGIALGGYAVAGYLFAFGEPTYPLPSAASLGFVGTPPPGGAIVASGSSRPARGSLVCTAPIVPVFAAANICLAGVLPRAGTLILSAIVPSYGTVIFAGVAVPSSAFVLTGEIPADGYFVLGNAVLMVPSIISGESLPQTGSIYLNYAYPPPAITVTSIFTGDRPTLTTTFTRTGVAVSTGLLVVITTTKDGANPTSPPSITYGGSPMTLDSTLYSGGYAARSSIFSIPVSTGSASLVFTGPLGSFVPLDLRDL